MTQDSGSANHGAVRIDAHQHFWQVERGDYFWLTPALEPLYRDFQPDDLAPLLAAAGVERSLLVQAAQTVAETEYMLSLAEAADFIAGVVGWVDFESPQAPDELARLAETPALKGLRPMIQDIADPDWMLHPALAPAYAALTSAGLVFDALVKPPHLANLITLVDRHPEMTAVIDHGAKPDIGGWAPGGPEAGTWAAQMRALAERPQISCKLSGLVTEASPDWTLDDLRPYVEVILEAFGPRRVLWGSDWPVLLLAGDYPRWRAATDQLLAELSDDERDQVLGGTAARVYGL